MNPFAGMLDWLADPAHWSGSGGIPTRLLEHLQYTGLAMAIGALIAIPLGIYLGHRDRGEILVLTVANMIRALPTLGVLTLLVIVVGIGLIPPLIALVAMAVPPMLVNSFEGIRTVDRSAVDAARAMGLGRWRTALTVELPSAVPVVLLGVRLALIQVISTATIAAYVGLGGLGRFVFDGLSTRNFDQVAGGALLVAVLAILTEAALILFTALAVSPGVARRPRPLTRLRPYRKESL